MITVRNLEKKDAKQVALLIGQLTPKIFEPEKLEKRITQLTASKNSRFLVATLSGKVVGVVGLAWHHVPSKGKIGWVEELVVDSKNRGQGVGTALMKNILTLAEQKKIKQVKLMTANPIAKKLYEKLEFVKKENEYLFRNL